MALFKDLNSIYYSRMHLFDRQFKESIEILKLAEIGTGSEDLLLSSVVICRLRTIIQS